LRFEKVSVWNFVKEPKHREMDKELEDRATEFHGHDGPFMIIGLRLGIPALKLLGCRGWFDLECEVRLNWSPPDSCVIDGVQGSTGCTMGKKNISVVEQQGIEVFFKSKINSLKITLKPHILDRIRLELEEDNVIILNSELTAEESELFDFELLV
jgi:formylmethanofuran dehydrogenase subunit E